MQIQAFRIPVKIRFRESYWLAANCLSTLQAGAANIWDLIRHESWTEADNVIAVFMLFILAKKNTKKSGEKNGNYKQKKRGEKCKSWENILINECGEIQIRHSSDFNSAAKSTKVFPHRCVDKHEQLPKQTDTQSGRKSWISYTDKDRDERAKRQCSTWGTLSPESSDKQWEGSGKKKKKNVIQTLTVTNKFVILLFVWQPTLCYSLHSSVLPASENGASRDGIQENWSKCAKSRTGRRVHTSRH